MIIEMLANENLSNDLKFLSFRGRVIIVGCRGSIEINPRDTMAKETSIIGVSLFSSTKVRKGVVLIVLVSRLTVEVHVKLGHLTGEVDTS